MSILPILGGGATPSSPPPVADPQTDNAAPPADTKETNDTAPPAPASEGQDSSTDTGSKPSDPQTEPARVSLLAGGDQGTTEQAVVEAALAAPPDQTEADARRIAEAAQQQQRLEMLIDAVKEPATLSAPSAEQEQAGPAETDGTPL